MTEVQHEDRRVARSRSGDRVDMVLDWTALALGVVVILFAAFFVYSVYTVSQADAETTPYYRTMLSAREAVRANPNDPALRVEYGITLGLIGEYSEALEQFEAALEIDPQNTAAYVNMGLMAIDQEEYDAAEEYLTEVVRLTEGTEMQDVNARREKALFFLGRIANQQDRYEDAIGYFKGALRIREDASDTYYHMALAFQGLDELDAAADNLEIALLFDPNYAAARLLLGEIYLEQDDDINAAVQFQLAAEAAPDADVPQEALLSLGLPEEWMASAREELAAGDLDVAIHDVLMARAVAPESAEAAVLHAEILEERGNLNEALRAYTEARELAEAEAVDEIQADIERLEAAGAVIETSTVEAEGQS